MYLILFFFDWQGRFSDTSTAESGSDVDDLGSPVLSRIADFTRLAPVHEEVSLTHLTVNILLSALNSYITHCI